MPVEQEGVRQHGRCDTFFLPDLSRLRMAHPTKNAHEYLDPRREEGERACVFLSYFYL
jgi:hypothetical protein